MSRTDRLTTILSTKGQVILPKAIREQRDWRPGTRLVVEETEEGVLLRRAPLMAATQVSEVFGRLSSDRAPVSIEEMDAAVALEAARRARD